MRKRKDYNIPRLNVMIGGLTKLNAILFLRPIFKIPRSRCLGSVKRDILVFNSFTNQQIKAAHHGQPLVESSHVAALYSSTMGPQFVPSISETPICSLAKPTIRVLILSEEVDSQGVKERVFKIAPHVTGPSCPSAAKPKIF